MPRSWLQWFVYMRGRVPAQATHGGCAPGGACADQSYGGELFREHVVIGSMASTTVVEDLLS